MRSIDIHAHISPEGFIRAAEKGEDWYGTKAAAGGMYNYNPRTAWSPEQRLADMNSLGVDIHVLSTNAYFYNYDKDAETVTKMSREANDYVSQLTKDHPTRFAGLANLPMQDVKASVAELERSMTQLGLKGAYKSVGADRVVLGTDWPADMMLDWPVSWVLRMDSLTQDEKEMILWKNLEKLLNI